MQTSIQNATLHFSSGEADTQIPEFGCSGTDCGKLHPTICPRSDEQLMCFEKHCPYKLHTQKCEREPWQRQPGRQRDNRKETPNTGRRQSTFHQAKQNQDRGFHGGLYKGRPKQQDPSNKGFELQLQKMVKQAVMAALQGSALDKRRDLPGGQRFF